MANGCVVQNPSFSGYAAVQAYEPTERLAIAVATTVGPKSPGGNTAQTITERIAALLDPGHPLVKSQGRAAQPSPAGVLPGRSNWVRYSSS
ncbi:hypothetical protein ACT1U9_00100 [Streptomyces sp. BR1]|uniref:hypothetical protein n=1 Tax=Streptomyces sp. BR1 TaxID=1592323 RepID=UPI00402BE127